MILDGVHQPQEQESSDLDDVLKGHGFSRAVNATKQ
jgi:hypothetical protein